MVGNFAVQVLNSGYLVLMSFKLKLLFDTISFKTKENN